MLAATAWGEARYFSAKKMAKLYDDPGSPSVESWPTPERQAEWRLVTKRAIEASLELADELEAA